MARRKIDYDKYASGIFRRTEQYSAMVGRQFESAVERLLKLTHSVELGEGELFSFSYNSRIGREANAILRDLYANVYQQIKDGATMEWEYANLSADALIRSIFGKGVESDNHFARYFVRNQEAMDAFFERKTAGLNLSQRVWNCTGQLKDEMELALSVAMGKGESASTISRQVRQYLQEPDKLFRRVRDEEGNLKLSRRAAEYHPGRGVYRSSYKNAMRLTRTETNMAYRSADHERWQRMDFVIGIEIQTSGNHPDEDICDELAGVYPKDFKFVGWHPQCRCFATPVLADMDDMMDWSEKVMRGEASINDFSPQQITELPENFTKWMDANADRIENASYKPYFLTDNEALINGTKPAIDEPNREPTAQEIAERRHAARTQEDIDETLQAWNNRKMMQELGDDYTLTDIRRRARRLGVDISELENFVRTSKFEYTDKWKAEIKGLQSQFDRASETIKEAQSRMYALRSKGWAISSDAKFRDIDDAAFTKKLQELRTELRAFSPKNYQWDEERFLRLIEETQRAGEEAIARRVAELERLRTAALAKNNTELEEALGIKRGKPMTFEEADEHRGNPNYGKGEQYSINCQTCVPANEMRRRGFNVMAMGNDKDEVWDFFEKEFGVRSHKQLWLEPDGKVAKWTSISEWKTEKEYERLTRKRIDEFFSDTCSVDGRYEVRCTWDGGKSGHVFCAERTNGVLKFWDAQTGSHDIMHYFDNMEWKSIEVLRIDNKLISPKFAPRFIPYE